jgi:diguanylate cyclase (GGDEF)-like protein
MSMAALDNSMTRAPAPASDASPIPRIAREHIVSLAKLVVEHALQPIVEINTGHVYGYEALVRGYERLNLASPTQLLDHAAAADSLVPLERTLIKRAIAKFASTADLAGKKLFLNLDGRALSAAEEFAGLMDESVRRHGIALSTVCLELSERHNNAAVPDFAHISKRLRNMGIRIAIDDFGIGFSELKMLCDYGIDYVKIDGHFVRDIAGDQRKRLFVTTIVNLAHVLGIRVIAEGVETEADFLGCREAGCDLVQGYFVARPTTDVSALLQAYGHVASTRANHRRSRKTDALLVRSEMLALPVIEEQTTLDTLFALFRNSPQQSFFPVVDGTSAPLGIIHERDLKPYIYTPFGRDLLRNKAFTRSVSSFVTPCPVADINSDAGRILETFANARGSDGIIVTENLRYLGVLSAPALLKVINEKQVQQAQDQNPLTELPGNLSISDHVAITALDGDQSRHFCYFDFDHFKPFNDRYGFQHGDRAIGLFAVLLRRHLAGPDTFLGHVGGDDFFACFSGRTRTELMPALVELLEEFRHDVRRLYSTHDQLAGATVAVDRDGGKKEFPLMRCSVAVLELPRGIVSTDLAAIDEMIARGKSEAKRSPDGMSWQRFAR